MLKIWVASGLLLGLTYSIDLIIAFRSVEKWEGILGYTPFNTLLYSPYMSFAVNGGFKVTNSYKTQPVDQMSDF